jgi:hypothetical protein
MLLEFLGALAGSFVGSFAGKWAADRSRPVEIGSNVPSVLASGPKVFRRAPKKATPKINDDQKAWRIENDREG